jgi:tape measure domain-containing protein
MTDPKIRYDIEANATGGQSIAALTAELAKLGTAVDPEVAARAKELQTQLEQLGQVKAAVSQFAALKERAGEVARALAEAQDKAQAYGREMSAVATPTRAQVGEFNKLRGGVIAAKEAFTQTRTELDASRGELTRLGVKLPELGQQVESVAASEVGLRKATKDLAQELGELGTKAQASQRFVDLTKATEQARVAMQGADAAADSFAAELAAAGAPTAEQTRKIQGLAEAARQSRVAYLQQAGAHASAGAELRALGVNTERLTQSQASGAAGARSAAQATQQLAAATAAQGNAAVVAGEKQASAHRKTSEAVASISQQLERLQTLSLAALGATQTTQMLKGAIETADAYANLSSRIKLVTGDGDALRAAMDGVYQVATRTNTSLEDTGNLFARIAQAGKEMGVGQEQALQVTETINQAIQLSGASAQAAAAGVQQLIQGLQAGVLRGEEFNSITEQSARLAQALADGLGVGLGKLREMAQAGQLTADVVLRAFQSQREKVSAEFEQLPPTVARAVQNVQTEWMRLVGTFNQSSGVTGAVAEGINTLARNLDDVAAMAARAGTVLVAALAVSAAQALRTYAAEAALAAGATNLLSASIANVPKVINITVAAVGLEVGYQIGQVLHDNFELARKFGIGITEFFVNLVNELRFVKEAAAAIFTDDTIEKAFGRFTQRAEQMQEHFESLYASATEAPGAIRAATDAAAGSAEKLGKATAGTASAVASAGAAAAGSVQSIGGAADSAASAIGALTRSARAATPDVVGAARQQAQEFATAAEKATNVADVFRRDLPQALAKLNAGELQAFRDAMTKALSGSTGQAVLLNDVIVETAKRAAQSLGVDVVAASSRMSAEFVSAQDALSLVVTGADRLKAAGYDAARIIEQMLAKMKDSAKNTTELDAVRNRVEALGKAGLLTKTQVSDMLDEIRRKADQVVPGINSGAEALQRMGIKTRAELRKTADELERYWEVIRDSTDVAIEDKILAFAKFRAAAIEANGDVESSEIRLAREILAAQAAARGLGQTMQREMDKATEATRKATRAIVEQRNAAGSGRGSGSGGDGSGGASGGSHGYGSGSGRDNVVTNQYGERLYQTEGTFSGDPGRFKLDPKLYTTAKDDPYGRTQAEVERLAGNTTGVDNSLPFVLREKYQAGTLTPDDLASALAALSAAKQSAYLTGSSQFSSFAAVQDAQQWVNTLQQIVDSLQSPGVNPGTGAGAGGLGGGNGTSSGTVRGGGGGTTGTAAAGSAAATPAASSSSGSGRTININLNGQTTRVNVASDTDASALESLLAQIGAAAARAGA